MTEKAMTTINRLRIGNTATPVTMKVNRDGLPAASTVIRLVRVTAHVGYMITNLVRVELEHSQ